MRERGGDNRPSAGDRIDQHPGGDLVLRVIGQHHDGGSLHQGGQRFGGAVRRIEEHRIGDPEALRLRDQSVAVGVALGGEHLRVGATGDQIPRILREVLQRGHRVDDPLDALARAQQAPGQDGRPARTHQRGGRGQRRAVRDGGHLAVIDGEAGAQTFAGSFGHHHHLVGQRQHLVEHRTLVWCRIFQHRMGDDDRRHPQALHDLDDLVAVRSAVNAVLVLDDGDVAAVEQLRGGRDGRRRAVDELAGDVGALRRGAVGDADDLDVDAPRGQAHGQGGAEGRQAACCRGVRTQNTETRQIRKALHPKGSG